MDYEKKYREALERAKIRRDEYLRLEPDSYVPQDIEYIFPELAESEDNNLKNKSGYLKNGKFWKASTLWNAVKDKVPQTVPNRYILQECTWNIGTLQRFADEVKNVQEVQLNYPIILDINGNILDGAHRVVKAYLEGKDIDIVYLGDDEWPEPDYDEEKAVKESKDKRMRKAALEGIEYLERNLGWDAIGDTDILDVKEYLEKQKEIPLMNGDVDLYFDTWNQNQTNPSKRQCFEEGIRYAQRLQKEQKPAEYLDKDKVYAIMKKLNKLAFSQLIPINSDEYKEINEITGDVRRLLDYTIEQKPAEWSEEDKK